MFIVFISRCDYLLIAPAQQGKSHALIRLDRFGVCRRVRDNPAQFYAVVKETLDLFNSPARCRFANAVVVMLSFRGPVALPLVKDVRSNLAKANELIPASPSPICFAAV